MIKLSYRRRERTPIELMFRDEGFIDFAVNHYAKLWEVAIKTAEKVDTSFDCDVLDAEVTVETFKVTSQPIVYLYEAYLHNTEEAGLPDLTEEQKQMVKQTAEQLKG